MKRVNFVKGSRLPVLNANDPRTAENDLNCAANGSDPRSSDQQQTNAATTGTIEVSNLVKSLDSFSSN